MAIRLSYGMLPWPMFKRIYTAFKILRNTDTIGDLIDIIAQSYDKIYTENFKTYFEYYQGEKLLKFNIGNKNPIY